MLMNKAKRFKLNIMKAFQVEEERQLQKTIWGAMIEDELPDESDALTSREVSPSPVALPPAPQAAQLAAPLPADPVSADVPAPEATPQGEAVEAPPVEDPDSKE